MNILKYIDLLKEDFRFLKKINSEKIIDKIFNEIDCLKYDTFCIQKEQLKTANYLPLEQYKTALCPFIFPNMEYVFPNIELITPNKLSEKIPDVLFLWSDLPHKEFFESVRIAFNLNIPVYIWENGYIRSAYCWPDGKITHENKFGQGISFIINKNPYFDATQESELEIMLNDKDLIISNEQKERARNLINKIINTHLTKYNHQPIFTPKIGRSGAKKVLVVDQTYHDMSILKGLATDYTFEYMLNMAIKENPDADIIIKTHPEIITGTRKGYYSNITSHDNIYTYTEPINPISLVKYVDKVYVCSSQLGFEALMTGKEVHTFGMPFYAGWGLTQDRQKCKRRTNQRTLEEVFYIAYIMNTFYINPERQCCCEIEEAMDYLLKLREEYFNKNNK